MKKCGQPRRDSFFIKKSDHWRARAEEANTAADGMFHVATIAIMRRIAAGYERMAVMADKHDADMAEAADQRRKGLR